MRIPANTERGAEILTCCCRLSAEHRSGKSHASLMETPDLPMEFLASVQVGLSVQSGRIRSRKRIREDGFVVGWDMCVLCM